MYDEAEYLMLSGIQHFAFCRRQWALIHIEQQWMENARTTEGKLMHKRAHDEDCIEKRGDTILVRGLKISSARLGISGQCDVVEFKRNSEGITLNQYDGKWMPFPVEYKRGEPKEGNEDVLQLCAQAVCLEEMLLADIPKGYLFYGETRRRVEVIFSNELRNEVNSICSQMHEYFRRGRTPMVKSGKKCRACSLNEICLPKLSNTIDVHTYISNAIGDVK